MQPTFGHLDRENRSPSRKPIIWNKNNREVRIKREADPFSTFKPLHGSDSALGIHNYDRSSSLSSLRPDDTHFHFSLANYDGPLLHPLDSSSNSVSAPLAAESLQSPFPPKPYLSSFLNALYSYPIDSSLDVLNDSTGFLGLLHDCQPLVPPGFTALTGTTSTARPVDSGLGFVSQNSGGPLFLPCADDGDFNPSFSLDAYTNPFFLKDGKPLKHLDIAFPPVGSNLTSTLLQRRQASQRISGESKPKCNNPTEENFQVPVGFNLDKGKGVADEELQVLNSKHRIAGTEVEEMKWSGLDSSNSEEQIDNYFIGESACHRLEFSKVNTSSVINGNEQGKGKPPAKNLMAERRRRKKLNDRLYMLRSIVPKISKMDRASILADAIDYLRELLDKIKLLNDELQSMSVTPLPTHMSPLPPTSAQPYTFNEDVSKNSPANVVNQLPMVHVEVREENAFNIHMFCTRRPGLLLSTIRALDSLGLDIQQAVISCFNGFALDIFRAENSNGGMELHQDQIKATLLDTAAFHGLLYSQSALRS